MKVFVVGVAHEVQGIKSSDSFREEQQRYRSLVSGLIERNSVALIGEEAASGSVSFAADAAEKESIKYLLLDIPAEVQGRIHHVPHWEPDYCDGFLVDRIAQCNKYAIAWTRVREYHMGIEFRSEISMKQTRVSLLICGDKHAFRIARILRQSKTESIETVLLRRADYRDGMPPGV